MHDVPVAEGRIIASAPDDRRGTDRERLAQRHAELERLSLFVRARRRAYEWSKPVVAGRADAIGEPYVSPRTIGNVENMEKPGYKPRTLRRLDMALFVPLGTVERVLAGPDRDPEYDPQTTTADQWLLDLAGMPELRPPKVTKSRPRGLGTRESPALS